MAASDKTYTDSYKDYKEFKDWADKQFITFFDGYKVCVGDWVWNKVEKDFTYGEIPIMNTSWMIDLYLVQNCPFKFVIDRMNGVYNKQSIQEYKNTKFPVPIPNHFKQNRQIQFGVVKGETKFPLHKHVLGGKSYWWLQCQNFNWNYNDETKVWACVEQYYPTWTNTAHIKSIKGVIRHLRKQYLPKGLEFRISGRYVGESYLIKIK